MTFAECIPYLLKQGRIRKPHFNENEYVALNEDNYNILTYFCNNGGKLIYEITDEDLSDVIWELVN